MKKLIIANWKLNPKTAKRAFALARASDFKNVVIAPPFVFLAEVGKLLRQSQLGAQNVSFEKSGPYTGEVSADELRHLGVRYVIVGHSERRALGETDVLINKKIKASLLAGLKVVLCVGEPWSVRKRGFAAAKNFVKKQLQKDLAGAKNHKLEAKNLIIAYEPIWAIGTGKSDKPEQTVEMIGFIKKILASPPALLRNAKRAGRFHILKSCVLYGGSVKAKNAASFFKEPEIGGALVGGASLRPTEFRQIVKIAVSSNY